MDWFPPEILAVLGIAAACCLAQTVAIVVIAIEVRGLTRHRGPR